MSPDGVRTALDGVRTAPEDVRKTGPFAEVYSKLYYLLAQTEEINAAAEAPGFALSEEGTRYFDGMQKYYKFDLCYHLEHLASWEGLAGVCDEVRMRSTIAGSCYVLQ
jgi:hypothetical protein